MSNTDKEDPPSTKQDSPALDTAAPAPLPVPTEKTNGNPHKSGSRNGEDQAGLGGWFKALMTKAKSNTSLREALEELIEETNDDDGNSIALHEKTLISNVFKLRDLKVSDVMLPRADIVAIDINTSQKELLKLLSEKQFSRIPVYRETLDDVFGTIHIKDIIACLAKGKAIKIQELAHDVPIVSPSMPVLDLILMMRQMRKHISLVIDEYGGVDGLVTINDIIENIIGEVEDEHHRTEDPQAHDNGDGSVLADGRLDIEEFEEKYGQVFNEDEREDFDTIGGLLFSMAGRIPARGEILKHETGMVFEILDADPRRVNKVLIKNIPQK